MKSFEEFRIELKEYSPNIAYQAKGGKKSGKLGKSSVYSLRGKDESKKDFRKSHVKDVEGGYVGGGHKPTPGSLKKEDYYRGTGETVVARTKKFMDKKGQKGAPGLDAMKARTAEHKAKRGVKEEIVAELNRYEKETGTSSGSMNMPKGKPTQKGGTSSPVMSAVRSKIRKETGKPVGQQKKVKGAKTNDKNVGLDRKINALKSKRALADKAKKAGYKSTQDYVNVKARYGSGGLGS